MVLKNYTKQLDNSKFIDKKHGVPDIVNYPEFTYDMGVSRGPESRFFSRVSVVSLFPNCIFWLKQELIGVPTNFRGTPGQGKKTGTIPVYTGIFSEATYAIPSYVVSYEKLWCEGTNYINVYDLD